MTQGFLLIFKKSYFPSTQEHSHSISNNHSFNMPNPDKPSPTIESPTHLRALIVLCKVFGARPIILDNDFQFARHRIISIAHILWSFIILGLIVFSMNELYWKYMSEIAEMLQILNICEYSLNVMNCLIIVVGTNYQRQWQAIYFRHIRSIDERLLFPANEANAELGRFLHVVFMISLAFIVPVMTIMLNFYFRNLRALVITYIAYIVTNLIIALGLIQFFVMIFMVEMRYKRLVSCLGGLTWMEAFNHLQKSCVIEIQRVGKQRNCSANRKVQTIKNRIDVLRTCYVDLIILEKNISESFGIFIVSLVISTFFVETSKLFVFYTLTRENVGFLTLAYSAFWLILHLVKIFALLFLSSRVAEAVRMC